MKKILLLDDLMVGADKIRELNRTNAAGFDCVKLGDVDVDAADPELEIIVTVTTPVNQALLQRFVNVKMVSVSFTGFNHVDLEYCMSRGIKVYNVPAYSTDSVAELTVALALSILRDIPNANNTIKNGTIEENRWQSGFVGTELAGKTVGVIGTGTIGCRVAEIFKVFGCRLLGWSRTQNDQFKDLGGAYVDREQLFTDSDIVTLHIALNDQTRGIVGAKEFALMKRSAIIINTARGPIIQSESLVDALRNGNIAAAGLDVFESESVAACTPFKGLGNVVLTPHVAYKTTEALERKAEITFKNIGRYAAGDSVNLVQM